MIVPNKAIKFVMNEMISKLVKPATRSAVNTKTILNMILCDCLNQVKKLITFFKITIITMILCDCFKIIVRNYVNKALLELFEK